MSGFNYIDNAGTATSKGIEAQITLKPIKAFEFGSSLNYTDAKLKTVNTAVAAKVGDRLPGSAPFTAYVYGQYDVPVGGADNLSFRADYSYTGPQFSYLNNRDDPSAIRYGKYASVGLRSTLTMGDYEVALFVRNLVNTRGRIAARRLYPTVVEVLQTPRTIGLTFRAKW